MGVHWGIRQDVLDDSLGKLSGSLILFQYDRNTKSRLYIGASCPIHSWPHHRLFVHKPGISVLEKERLVNLWFFLFSRFLLPRRAAHVAARISAALAECAVRAWVLLRRFLVHGYMFHPSQLRLFYIEYRIAVTTKTSVPFGLVTVISSPAALRRRAFAMGESILMKFLSGSNSSGPTMR